MASIVTGIPNSWDSCTASTTVEDGNCYVVWSPCGKFIAISSGDGIGIRDSNTLERLSILKHPESLTPTLSEPPPDFIPFIPPVLSEPPPGFVPFNSSSVQ